MRRVTLNPLGTNPSIDDYDNEAKANNTRDNNKKERKKKLKYGHIKCAAACEWTLVSVEMLRTGRSGYKNTTVR